MKVCIIQPVMKAYRLPFFVGLAERLARSGIALHVVYGTPWPREALRGDHVELPPPLGCKVKSRMLFDKLYLLPTLRSWLDADLVVIEHANKHLLNFLLAALWALRVKRIAYWGHGRDRQSAASSLGERFKRRSLHWADWWFAYTGQATRYVATQGFPAERVTTVENAIDTRALRADLAAADPRAARAALGWGEDDWVGVYCGSLYTNKRLDLLFEAADQIHARRPEFRLLIIGGGPLAEEVTRYAQDRAWVRAVGPRFGADKAALLRQASVWLNPGLVGLGILDAFCAGLPVITTDLPLHSPEIEYLADDGNGLLLPADARAYAEAVLGLLADPARLRRLSDGALASAQRYSIETMVENFATGVEQCLTPC